MTQRRRSAAFLAILLPSLLLPALSPPAQAEPPRRPNAAQLEAIRRWLCPNGGSPVKGVPGRCDRAMDRAAGRGGSWGGGAWDTGLAPPRRDAGMACPEGTRPVLARGHRDIIRCLPS